VRGLLRAEQHGQTAHPFAPERADFEGRAVFERREQREQSALDEVDVAYDLVLVIEAVARFLRDRREQRRKLRELLSRERGENLVADLFLPDVRLGHKFFGAKDG
jgi:hypothetical protein